MKRSIRKRNNLDTKHDIFQIHEKIMKKLEKEYNNLPALKKELEVNEKIMNSGKLKDQYKAIVKYNSIKRDIELIESGKKIAQYIYKSEDIIKRYNEILKKPITIDFDTGKKDNENQIKPLLVEFVNIAREYVDISPIALSRRNVMNCENCNIEMFQHEDLLFVCEKCGYSERTLEAVTNYQDNSRINTSQRYVYEKRANFLNSIKEFQGIQNTSIPDEVRKGLIDQITSHDISREKLTKDHIIDFLKIIDKTDHYKDTNLLFSELTGKPAPDISDYVSSLLSMFDMALPVFERVKSPDRLNFLNGQFVLFKFLQLLGYPCNEDDFYPLKTRDKVLEHDQKWKIICDELEWYYIPTI